MSEKLIASAIESARKNFLAFCLLMNPHFILGPHHSLIAEKLTLVREGKIKRLMIFLPPRSSKSYMTSLYFPAWCLGQCPYWEIIEISHSNDLATGFSREVRNLIDSAEYQMIFPDITLRPDSRAANRWHTNKNGQFQAAGTSTKIAGIGANVLILDDPLSEQDAWSKAKRNEVNRKYQMGWRSRLFPAGRVVLTNTRWHEDDLSGHLLRKEKTSSKADKWEVISIPALLDEETAIVLEHHRVKMIEQGLLPESYPPIEAGQSYWPPLEENLDIDRGLRGWTTQELLDTKDGSTEYEWSAVYMQRPVAEEGNLIKRSKWMLWPEDEAPPKIEFLIMTLDTAYGEKEVNDYSVIQKWGIFRDHNSGIPNVICLGNKRGRWTFPDLVERAYGEIQDEQPDLVLIEKKASGMSLIQSLNARGVPVQAWEPDGRGKDKVSRAWACTPLFEGGRVWIPAELSWAQDLMAEASAFPASPNDDQVDAMTQALLWMKNSYLVNHPSDVWQNTLDSDTMEPSRRRYYV